MKLHIPHKISFVISMSMSLAFSSVANAAVFTHVIAQEFTESSPTKTILPSFGTIGNTSFYSSDMGHEGWLHTSAWGYAKLKKGVPVTIQATASDTNFHPAIAVWQFAGNAPIECAQGMGVGVGPYVPWADVYVKKITDPAGENVDPSCNKVIGKSLFMKFIANGVDRDGWDAPADIAAASTDAAKYDTTMVNRLLDGESGKVSVTFTPPANGIYKFVVGGMHPNAAVGPSTTIDVTVNFPE